MDGTLTTLSVTHPLIGTPLYLSPEAITGEAPTVAFDPWSLNVLLCEAVAGRHPFRAETLTDTFARIQAGQVPDACRRRAGHTRVAEYFDRALAKDPRVRPQTALEVAERLNALREYA